MLFWTPHVTHCFGIVVRHVIFAKYCFASFCNPTLSTTSGERLTIDETKWMIVTAIVFFSNICQVTHKFPFLACIQMNALIRVCFIQIEICASLDARRWSLIWELWIESQHWHSYSIEFSFVEHSVSQTRFLFIVKCWMEAPGVCLSPQHSLTSYSYFTAPAPTSPQWLCTYTNLVP